MADLWIVSLIILLNTFLYMFSFYLIIKNKHIQTISMRSPNLLLLNNLGGFLMSTTYIFYELLKSIYPNVDVEKNEGFNIYCKILPNNYGIFHFLMILPYFLRYHRIIACCVLESDEDMLNNDFGSKRHRYMESYYLKILAILMFIIVIISFTLNYLVNNYYITPFYFDSCFLFKNKTFDNNTSKYISYFWLITNFIEQITLATYLYFVFMNGKVNENIKIEFIIFISIWFIFPNVLRIFDIFTLKISDFTICIICLFFLYGCLFVNGYLPIMYTLFPASLNYK